MNNTTRKEKGKMKITSSMKQEVALLNRQVKYTISDLNNLGLKIVNVGRSPSTLIKKNGSVHFDFIVGLKAEDTIYNSCLTGTEPNSRSILGYGKTKFKAILDLLKQVEGQTLLKEAFTVPEKKYTIPKFSFLEKLN